jgi:chemotaxis protein methyltransferase WspC
MTALERIEAQLKRHMGLDAASIGISSVERAVARRLDGLGLKSIDAYAELLSSSSAEMQELIEVAIVPETWFFRDPEAFAAVTRAVTAEWLTGRRTSVVRLLSIPCSTGEEAYTMAMALSDAGIDLDRVHIDAVDISARNLQAAHAGVYRKNSFRGEALEFKQRHFTAKADGFHVSDRIRKPVHFQQGNLLSEGFLSDRPAYDFIFCRNLLIYFDQATQDRAISVLSRLLHPHGMILVGPSESGLLLRHEFESAKIPLAFAFRRRTNVPREAAPLTPRRPVRSTAPPAKRVAPPSPPAKARTVQAPPQPSKPEPSGEDALAKAARLADEGHLVEAAHTCEEHLRKHGPSAQVFYLLALVRDAAGESDEASDFYRKALYLDPNHPEALLHASLLAQKRGDAVGAAALLRRAQRAQPKP